MVLSKTWLGACTLLLLTLPEAKGRVSPRLKGCLKGRVEVGGLWESFADLSVESCTSFCFRKGFTHASLFNSTYCGCGDFKGELSTLPETECSLPCGGNRIQRCGGREATSLYHTGIKEVTSIGKEIGCLSDGGPSRLLDETKMELTATNSPDRCVGICNSLQYRYAGLQDSVDCYCGNMEESGVEETDCNLPCPGEKGKTCGGKYKMMVYKTGILGGVHNTRIQYLGCYKNRQPGLLKQFQITYDDLTPIRCLAKCFSLKYEYGALYNGKQCQCGRAPVPVPETSMEAACSTPCAGNQSSTCGGDSHVSGYYIGVLGDPVLGRSLGCFKEEEGSLPSASSFNFGQRNSPHFCIAKCMEFGFPYAALANTYECRCISAPPSRLTSLEVRASECNSICPLSKTEFCGGPGLAYIYRTGLDNTFEEGPCKTSSTEINGRHSCTGDIVLEEKFDTLDFAKWKRTVQISNQDHEFVIYNSEEENVFIKDGMLIIKPTMLNETFITSGSLNLKGCTARLYTSECEQTAQFYSILPPIKSAKLCSTSFFKYGVITVRAKLPSGDWLIPRLELRPTREVYGKGYLSGLVRIASSRGNAILASGNNEIGSRLFEVQIKASSGGEDIKTKSVSYFSAQPWTQDFHNFSLVWSPDGIWAYVDDQVSEKKKVYESKEGSLASVMGFTWDETKSWAPGTYMAPFDIPVEICFGVGVGGSRDFPDGSVSNGKIKPWRNYEVKGTLNFWRARSDWEPSWSAGSELVVDSVRIKAV